MSDVLDLESAIVRQAIAFGLDVSIKSTVLLVLAIGIHAILGHRRVLARSALWNASLAALLVLPAVVALSPRWRVGGIWRLESEMIARPFASARPDLVPRSQKALLLQAARSGSGLEYFRDSYRLSPNTGEAVPQSGGRRAVRQSASESTPIAIPARGPTGMLVLGSFGLAVVIVYCLGVTVLAVRLLVSLAALAHLRRRSIAVDTRVWREGLERWRASLGIDRPVTLGRSDHVNVPVAFSWLRPSILVPRFLAETSDSRLIDAVLIHELCHIRRGDFAWNVACKLARVVYWPQPLIWLAGRLIHSVREQACDELCVHALGSSQGYRGPPRDRVQIARTATRATERVESRIGYGPIATLSPPPRPDRANGRPGILPTGPTGEMDDDGRRGRDRRPRRRHRIRTRVNAGRDRRSNHEVRA